MNRRATVPTADCPESATGFFSGDIIELAPTHQPNSLVAPEGRWAAIDPHCDFEDADGGPVRVHLGMKHQNITFATMPPPCEECWSVPKLVWLADRRMRLTSERTPTLVCPHFGEMAGLHRHSKEPHTRRL